MTVAFVHGKNTYVSLNSSDLSPVSSKSVMTKAADTHDITMFGASDYAYQGGLKKGDASIEGTYDSTAVTGPRAIITPLLGTTVTFIRRPEGTGTGKAQDSCSVVVEKYVETNPVNDMVTWAVDLKITGAVTTTAQS